MARNYTLTPVGELTPEPPTGVVAGPKGSPGPPGPAGPEGPPGSAYAPQIEDLRPQIGISVTLFTLAYTYLPLSVELVWNGQPMVHGQGILEVPPNQIQMEIDTAGRLIAPSAGQGLYAKYFR